MLDQWGRAVTRGRWIVVIAAALFAVFGVVWGTGVVPHLSQGGFEDPSSQSYHAAEVIEQSLGRPGADLVVLYTSEDRTVDDPAVREAVDSNLQRLPADKVKGAVTYWSTGNGAFVSADRHSTYAALTLAGATREDRVEDLRDIEDTLRSSDLSGLGIRLGGVTAINEAINAQVSEDLARAESLSIPILLILLVIVFGSVVAAGLPLLVGVLAVLGSFTVLRLITTVTDVSIFSINIVTLLGLGLAIDYALFIVSRFREEIRAGRTTPDAMGRTMATAGRTVAFSAITVAVSLSGLTLFPQVFLKSMAYGGIAAVLIAMVTALTVLPAVLAIVGRRVDALSLRRLLRRRPRPDDAMIADGPTGADAGRWGRLAHSVMRRPVPYVVAVLAVLAVLAGPALGVRFGGIDARALPTGAEARVVDATLRSDFRNPPGDPIQVVIQGPAGAADTVRAEIAGLAGVTGVTPGGTGNGTTLLQVGYRGSAVDSEALDVVSEIRALDLPAGTSALVGGSSAEQLDLRSSLADRLPWTAALVGLATFVLLFLAFGSLVLPVKAIVMNILSVTASFGVVVWIFQEGHLADLLGFTSTGSIETSQPILMVAILFGLSTDYEVFLLSRIREHYDRTGDNTASVAAGLQRTGRIITSAALLLVIVIGAFSTSGITFIKMIGVGMAVAIIVDATIVRAVLVPATMRLLGRLNWWAPGPLRRLWERYGISEGDEPGTKGPGQPEGSGTGAQPELAGT